MRKPIEDKSPLAAWATLARDEAGMSVEEAVAALLARGHSVTAATIRGIEGGSKGASVRLRRLLAEVYGVNPPGQKETGPALGEAGLGALVEALHAQTLAINALVTELREDRRLGSEVRERVAESAAFLVERELRRQAGRPQGDETPEDEQSGSAPLPAAR